MERLINPEWRELGLGRLVELAHQYLALDVVFVVELTADGLVCCAVAGDAKAFNITPEGHWPDQSPDAGALVSSEIANVIRDAHTDERVAGLPMVGTAQVGSFIGVPLRLSDGTLWGTFCCLSHEPDLALGEH